MARIIKKQAPFDAQLENAVTNTVARQNIEVGLRFALSEAPEAGTKTARAAPMPVYVWYIFSTRINPPLAISYCFNNNMTLLLSVKVLDKDPQDEES